MRLPPCSRGFFQGEVEPLFPFSVVNPMNSAGELTEDSTTVEHEIYRMIPNACLAKGKTQQCKHEAPWTKKLNDGDQARPLLICPGIAKNEIYGAVEHEIWSAARFLCEITSG